MTGARLRSGRRCRNLSVSFRRPCRPTSSRRLSAAGTPSWLKDLDITHIFKAAPELQELELCGHFALQGPVHHRHLHRLSAQIADVGDAGGPLSQETFSHLLSSTFPSLETVYLDLDEGGNEADYVIPERFFAGRGFPALATFELDRISPESSARLTAWKNARRIGR